jgi:hypothetical protein
MLFLEINGPKTIGSLRRNYSCQGLSYVGTYPNED